ncbi:tetratricopeptide repeat protein [Methanocella arvoryzae]|uniref:tetratricopeptide repeat protein n=1 Tax=Methanocella arvoryzae TaxID=1175445 RepID=UPI0003217679|nr:tetratricopeptide repeat protein [Methanocella arvoryzae]
MLSSSGAQHSRTDGLADDVLQLILLRSAGESFGGILNEEQIEAMVSLIATHDTLRADSGEEGTVTYSRYVYEMLSRRPGMLPDAGTFDSGFARFLQALDRRIEDAIAPKLVRLPRRKFGEPGIGELAGLQPPEALADYMSWLIWEFRNRGLLSGQEASRLRGTIDKLSSAPGYLRYLDTDRRDREAAWLQKMIRRLKTACTLNDPCERDLIVSLGIILFNLSPSQQTAAMLSDTTPAGACRALQYLYNAIMALNYVRAGRPGIAEAYAIAALKSAASPEERAHIGMVKGCIATMDGDYDLAARALRESAEVPGISARLKGMAEYYAGVVLYEKGEYVNAMASFEKAVSYVSDPGDLATIHNSIGSCAMQIGDEARADQEFQTVEELAVSLRGARTSQCMLLVSSYRSAIRGPGNDPGKAVEYYRRALNTASERGDYRSVADLLGNLGLAQARAGDYAHALHTLRACMTSSENAEYWAGIRFAYWHINRILSKTDCAEAKRFRETYTEKYPELREM